MSDIETATTEGTTVLGANLAPNRESTPPLARVPSERPPASERSLSSERGVSSERSYLSVFPARKVSLSQRVPAAQHVQQGALSTRQKKDMLIAFDERQAPVFITTFEGTLDLESVAWHDEVSSKAFLTAIGSGRRIVHIVDARRVNVPNAQLRRHWATRIQQSVGTLETMLGNFVVIDSPVLRGVLTAIDWLCNEARRIEYFSTLSDAVAVANLRLAAAGLAPVAVDAVNYRIAATLEPLAFDAASASA